MVFPDVRWLEAVCEDRVARRGLDAIAHLLERGDRDQLLVVWSREASHVADIRLPRRVSRVTEYSLDGAAAGNPAPAADLLHALAVDAGEDRVFEIN